MAIELPPSLSAAAESRDVAQAGPVWSPDRADWLCNLGRRLLLGALGQMKQGRLSLQLPDGETCTFGDVFGSPHPALIQVRRSAFFRKVLLYGHIGFAEAYMDGDWDTPDIEAIIAWFILNMEKSPLLEGSGRQSPLINLLGQINRVGHWVRANTVAASKRNIHEHYDLGNDFFKLFLDPTLTYSSAKFTQAGQSLEAAQIEKYDALCRKLKLSAQDSVLEIGTGWGGFSLHAAKTYGCKIHTITISEEQHALATRRIQDAGLAHRVTVELTDYRQLKGQYDKIVSIEMLEAVGDAYMEAYFGQCHALLKPNGLLGVQVITCPDARYEILKNNVDFIQKHIFPGSLLPSLARMNRALNRTGSLFLHDLEDLGGSYAETLQRWHDAFNRQLPAVRALGFNDRFIRKWNYYFLYCKAAFRMRNITVVQAIYTRPNNLLLSDMPL